MINVNELKRNAKNIVKKYSDAQVKVREATSNDPWGPSSTIMAEIADMTYNVVAFSEIMQMIWKRLNDHGKNWRHVFKSLALLEYLIKTGNDKVAQQCIENIFAIQTLKDFQYIEDNKDHGSSIREKSKKLVTLLKDPERLKVERARALKAKSRLIEAVSSSGQSSGFESPMSRASNLSADLGLNGSGGSSSSGGMLSNSNNHSHYQFAEADSSSALGSDIDSARPHSLTEEETQLQMALALSKEEAERQEKTRKNDELRLKLALNVSKQAASGSASGGSGSDFVEEFSESSASTTNGPSRSHHQSASRSNNKQSNIDDLLGLSFTPTESSSSSSSMGQAHITSTNPNRLFSSQPSTTLATNSPIGSRLEPQNDPWSVDPWQSMTAQPEALIKTNVIPAQPATGSRLSGFAIPTFPLATTLPSTQHQVNSATTATTTLVPNQFNPISNTNIAGIFSTASITTAATTGRSKKTLSKNPFED